MIVSFTDAQDASWSEAVAQVQVANEVGTLEMQRYAESSEAGYAESSKRASEYRSELDMGGQTATAQRDTGRGALEDVTTGLRSRLEGYGRETMVGAGEHVEAVDGFCGRMGATANSGECEATRFSLLLASKFLDSLTDDGGVLDSMPATQHEPSCLFSVVLICHRVS